MTKRNLTKEDREVLHSTAKQWGKIIAKRAFGEDGPTLDVSLDDIETVAQAALEGLNAGILESATSQQAQRLQQLVPCPACGLHVPWEVQNRDIITAAGKFTHPEPSAYCPTCRRAFFPSTPPSPTQR